MNLYIGCFIARHTCLRLGRVRNESVREGINMISYILIHDAWEKKAAVPITDAIILIDIVHMTILTTLFLFFSICVPL